MITALACSYRVVPVHVLCCLCAVVTVWSGAGCAARGVASQRREKEKLLLGQSRCAKLEQLAPTHQRVRSAGQHTKEEEEEGTRGAERQGGADGGGHGTVEQRVSDGPGSTRHCPRRSARRRRQPRVILLTTARACTPLHSIHRHALPSISSRAHLSQRCALLAVHELAFRVAEPAPLVLVGRRRSRAQRPLDSRDVFHKLVATAG